MEDQIIKMIEDGFAIKRIASILNVPVDKIKLIIQNTGACLKKEVFSLDKMDYVIDLYKQGVSAKSLGLKYNIDKRRVQKWVSHDGSLRSKDDSHRFTFFNQNIFDIIDTPAKAYWLGFFYADAYNCDVSNTFSITLKGEDDFHLIKLCNFIGLPINKINRYNSILNEKEYPTCSLRMYSKHLCQKMISLGCPQAKSFLIKYPEWLDKNLTIDFIRGMFDGDGSLAHKETNEWNWSIATTKECGEILQDIVLKETGLIANLAYISKTYNNTYLLNSSGNKKVLKLAEWLYKDSLPELRLDRKYLRYLELQDQQDNRTFSRTNYKVSQETKDSIIKDINEGEKLGAVSRKYKVHTRTATQIMSNNKDNYLFSKIPKINDNYITAPYVKTLDYDERKALVEPLFIYFRNQGWLYPDDSSKINNSWKKLCKFTPDLLKNEMFNNSSLATDICKFFCHKFYDATERNKPTMIEVFNDDKKLRLLIENRLGLNWWENEDNDETFNICHRMLVQGMRSARLVPSISIFKPDIAKYLYMKYSEEGDTVYDYSAGWGGRMLGAASCNRKYIGTDPWTTEELETMKEYLKLPNITLIKDGSENVKLKENSIDFSFSSPPYYSQEFYSKDLTQAYNQGDDYFYNIYWKKTMENIKFMLKPNKIFGLNILDKYTEMTDITKEYFGEPIEIVKLRTVRNHLTKTAGINKFEPVYIYKNVK